MKRGILKGLGVIAALAVLNPPILSAFVALPRPAGRSRTFQSATSNSKNDRLRDALGRLRPTSRKLTDKLAWLLKPQTFERLSSGGRRAAMLANGLLEPPPPSRGPVSMESRERPQQAAPLQNIMVDNPGNDVDGHTHSETSIAVNGSTIIEAFNDAYDANDSGYAVSTDAGNTWTARRVPVPAGLVGLNLGDPVVAFGPSGEIYYSMVSLVLTAPTDIEFIATVAKSTDNGLSFSQPVNASTTAGNP